MTKKHILTIGLQDYAFDSLSAAANVLKALEKAIPVKWNYDHGHSYYEPEELTGSRQLEFKMNCKFKARAPEPKAKKPLGLPRPKRGTILCICERSSVAPGETCAHCGRSFTESHNRTHGDDSSPKLRLV